VLGIELEKFSWNQLRIGCDQRLISVEAIVKSNLVLRLRIGLRNEQWRKIVLKNWHCYVGFEILVDPGCDDKLAQISVLLADSFLKQRLAADNEDLFHASILV